MDVNLIVEHGSLVLSGYKKGPCYSHYMIILESSPRPWSTYPGPYTRIRFSSVKLADFRGLGFRVQSFWGQGRFWLEPFWV